MECFRCNDEKPLEEFPVQKKRGKPTLRGVCRKCVNQQQKESYLRHHESRKKRLRESHAKNRDRNNAASRDYHKKNRDKAARKYAENRTEILVKDWERGIQRRYGVSASEYNSMLASQGGRCAICETSVPWSRSGRFAIDHNHKTGKVRKLLCHSCNQGIGKFSEDPEILRRAAAYIEIHS